MRRASPTRLLSAGPPQKNQQPRSVIYPYYKLSADRYLLENASQSEYRRSITASQTVMPACTDRYSVTMRMSVTRTQHSYRPVSRAGDTCW